MKNEKIFIEQSPVQTFYRLKNLIFLKKQIIKSSNKESQKFQKYII